MGGWASLVERDVERLKAAMPGLLDLAIGGTAVGTGLNSHPEFGERAAKKIAELTGLPFTSHANKFAALLHMTNLCSPVALSKHLPPL